MKALVVTGSRADFGLWQPVLAEMRRRPASLRPQLLVTGMHLDRRFGFTADEVRASGYEIAAEVPCIPDGDSRADMAVGLGDGIRSMAPVIERVAPDWLMLLGDRGEQLAAAVVALHQGIAVAHVHGGERSLGAVDDAFRDMITRIAHLHLVADETAAARLRRLGEAPWRIHVTGAPGIDDLRGRDAAREAVIRRRLGVDDRPYAVVVYHPETVGRTEPVAAVRAILRAVEACGLGAVAVLPNADAGGRSIRHALISQEDELSALFASLPRDDYLALLGGAAALVGNSSSALIEAPMLRLPAVNVGERQRGRLRGDNVIEADNDETSIRVALATALARSFRGRLSGQSPYGTGQAGKRIVDALCRVTIDRRLLVKEVG